MSLYDINRLYRNQYIWKFELNPIIFLYFTGIWRLKYKENKSQWCKTVWGACNCLCMTWWVSRWVWLSFCVSVSSAFPCGHDADYIFFAKSLRLVGWLWFNVRFSDISTIYWRDSCPVSKFWPAAGHPTSRAATGLQRAEPAVSWRIKIYLWLFEYALWQARNEGMPGIEPGSFDPVQPATLRHRSGHQITSEIHM